TPPPPFLSLFLSHAPSTSSLFTLSLHDALPIFPHPCVLSLSPTAAAAALCVSPAIRCSVLFTLAARTAPILPKPSDASSLTSSRSEEHTSELQSPYDLVCRLLLEKKNKNKIVKR